MTVLLLGAVLLAGFPVWAQEMDYNSDQYAEYERVVSIEDPVERAEAILVFMREHKGLSLVNYALKSYGDTLEQFRTGNEFDKYLMYSEKLIEARPEDTQLANNLLQSMTLSAYQIKNFDATIKYGEKAYANNPTPNLAFVLANSYHKKDDKANVTKYGDIALQEMKPVNTIEIATWLRAYAVNDKDFKKAAGYAEHVLRSLDAMKKPANVPDADWQKYTRGERVVSLLIIGQSLYEGEKYAEAVKQFEKVVKTASDPKFKSESYYYIGLSHWKQGSMDPAMRAFALGAVLKTPGHSEACQKYLEQLYKSTHNGSTAGLDEFIARITNSD